MRVCSICALLCIISGKCWSKTLKNFKAWNQKTILAYGMMSCLTYPFIVKVSHQCTKNFMNYIPIFLQLLKELPRWLHQVVVKVPLVTSRHLVLIERRGVFRTSLVRLLWQSEIYVITKWKNMLMCLHFKVCHYDFNIKIYCICFISYKSPLFWNHIHFWLTGQTNLWRSKH